ncbi:WYL domain-containing protein [uncultured Sphingomonas sp.]|uniref:WYL domain-containing protein n=1 Tax=uncultured Sphingomonas sp. TaxID=158754 RepID=UPI0035CC0254
MTRHPLRRGTATAVLLEYVDGKDDRSLRTVMPLAILVGDGKRTLANTYLQARCSVAKATRSFRLDRVQDMSDPKTGEVFTPIDWMATLNLSEGQPFTWAEDADERPATPSIVPTSRWLVWRVALCAVVIGYLIGRLRLLHAVLHLFGVHQARWL